LQYPQRIDILSNFGSGQAPTNGIYTLQYPQRIDILSNVLFSFVDSCIAGLQYPQRIDILSNKWHWSSGFNTADLAVSSADRHPQQQATGAQCAIASNHLQYPQRIDILSNAMHQIELAC